MEVFRFDLPIEKFDAMPVDERSFLILAGHAINEITVLAKLLITAAQGDDDDITSQLQTVQIQVLARLLIGKLHEGHLLIERMYLKKPIGRRLKSQIGEEALAALKKIKSYFSKSPAISRIRNDYAFHSPTTQDVERGYEVARRFDDLCYYMTKSSGNASYLASEVIISCAMLDQVGSSIIEMHGKILLETRDIAEAMRFFLDRTLSVLYVQYFGLPKNLVACADIPAPNQSELRLPFLISPSA